MVFFTEKFAKRLAFFGGGILFTSLVLFLWKDWTFNLNAPIKADKLAQYGDLIGGLVGSIWAFSGIILFYVALKEQRKDFDNNKKVLKSQTEALNLQIKEFKLQRLEMEETKKIFEEQNTTLYLQQFESTFYNQLNVHNSIVNSIKIDFFDERFEGRDCFSFLCKVIKSTYEKYKYQYPKKKDDEILKISYTSAYKKHENHISHYYKTLYCLLSFIKDSNIKNTTIYTDIAKAQLSNSETKLLIYYALFSNDDLDFLALLCDLDIVDREKLENINLINLLS